MLLVYLTQTHAHTYVRTYTRTRVCTHKQQGHITWLVSAHKSYAEEEHQQKEKKKKRW